MHRMNRGVYLLAVIGLAVAGAACDDDEAAEPTIASTTTTVDAPMTSDSSPDDLPVTVTSDVRFADASPDLALWSDPVLDVYSPQGANNLPLVVLLTPHGFTKDNPPTVQLANGVAEQGAVVVVANWSQQEDPPETFEDPAALTEMARMAQSVAGCAVAFAASRAGEFGADPSRLVLVGELYGANTASMVALGTADPSPGCLASTTEWSATGLVGLNDDWLAGAPYFDAVASAAVEVFSPWALLDRAPRSPRNWLSPRMLSRSPGAATIGMRTG